MIPARFVIEFQERCLELIEATEHEARERSLLGSFALMIAPSLFLVPYERMKNAHPLREASRERDIFSALKRVNRQRFLDAEFWTDGRPTGWRQSKIVSDVESTEAWRDQQGFHPMHKDARNEIDTASVDKVMRVIRNALAHGNIIYLDENGFERRGARLQYLAFLSRHDEAFTETCVQCGQQRKPEGADADPVYRVVVVTEEGFLSFLRCWARWLQAFKDEGRILEAAA